MRAIDCAIAPLVAWRRSALDRVIHLGRFCYCLVGISLLNCRREYSYHPPVRSNAGRGFRLTPGLALDRASPLLTYLGNQFAERRLGSVGFRRNGSATMPRKPNDPNHWRDRAARMRSLASTAINQDMFDLICDLADDFDKMADRVQKRADDTTTAK